MSPRKASSFHLIPIPEVATLSEEIHGERFHARAKMLLADVLISLMATELALMDSPMATWIGALIKKPAAGHYRSLTPTSEDLLVERHALAELDEQSLSVIKQQLSSMQKLHSHPSIVTLKVG